MSEIEQKHEEIKGKIEDLNKETSALKGEIAELIQNKIPPEKKKISDLKEQIDPAKSGYESKKSLKKTEELQNMNRFLSACGSQRTQLEKDKQAIETDINKLKTEIMNLNMEVDRVTKIKNATILELQRRKSERQDSERKLEVVTNQFEEIKRRFKLCPELKKEFANLQLLSKEPIPTFAQRARDLFSRMKAIDFDVTEDELCRKIIQNLPKVFTNTLSYYNNYNYNDQYRFDDLISRIQYEDNSVFKYR